MRPGRELVFDLNDFDEAGVGPWEWDVRRRLAASVHIGGRDLGLREDVCRDAVVGAVEAYRMVLRDFVTLSAVDRYFFRVDTSLVAQQLGSVGRRTVQRATDKARTRTSDQVLRKLTTRSENGVLRIDDQPPVLRHVDHATLDEMVQVFDQYRTTLREDVAYLLAQFRPVDYALRVVGVGSVGTRCYLIAFEGPAGEMLFLQATSDPFLGWIIGWAGEVGDRPRVDYYWRQFRDMKGSIDPSTLTPAEFVAYGALCGALLARARGQSPAGAAVAAYLGGSERFALATASWAAAYADVAEADYAALETAAVSGRIPVERGV
ncbi:DUF2252 family protein [Pseudonocardia sp.]|uniref:DUF2252 family protein n=1 Tax=Pseudonocardia sp. TaxID=60912 RepID=UPI003D0AB9F8